MTLIFRWSLMILLLFTATVVYTQVNSVRLNKSAFAPKFMLPKGETLYINGNPVLVSEQLNMLVVEQVGDSLNVIIENENENSIAELDGSNHTTSLYVGDGAHLHIKYRDWDTSPLIIPIKIRPVTDDTPLEFAGEFTIGSYLGYQLGARSILNNVNYNYSQTFSVFAAPTMIKINPEVADTDNSNVVLGFFYCIRIHS